MSDERLTKIETLLLHISSGQGEIKEALRGLHRDIGRIEARMEHIDDQVDNHAERIARLEQSPPGGGKGIAAVAGGAGIGIGAAMDWLLHFFHLGGNP